MMWLIGAAAVLGGILLVRGFMSGKRNFIYRGRRYSRHGDGGGFTYVDGSPIADDKERADVEAHWNDSHSSDGGSSDGGDGGGDGGGGGGGGD